MTFLVIWCLISTSLLGYAAIVYFKSSNKMKSIIDKIENSLHL
jgi:hypothetical protein